MLIYTSPELVLSAMLDGATGSLKLTVRLFAVYTVWLSIIQIMQSCGMSQKLASVFMPITRRIFKGESRQAQEYISLNLSANMLGVGSAATPFGIKAIEEMDKGNSIATDNMLLFVIINCTGVQLLPTTVIGLRATAGSLSPSDIIIPTLISTLISSIVGIGLCLICSRASKHFASKRLKNE